MTDSNPTDENANLTQKDVLDPIEAQNLFDAVRAGLDTAK
jgi:hypothetical protein